MKPITRVKRSVDNAWTELRSRMQTISSISQVKPSDSVIVFKHDHQKDYGKIITTVGPVSFSVPFKANKPTANVFVTIKGEIQFSDIEDDGPLRSLRFATEVAYFIEIAPNKLKHVFGVHYDYDTYNVFGHPIYHSQMNSNLSYFRYVNDAYHRTFNEPNDDLGTIMRQMRIPTAQMDPFSVFLQVCSDHLINENTDANGQVAYAALTQSCGFFECNSRMIPRFGAAFSQQSLRSHHWYKCA